MTAFPAQQRILELCEDLADRNAFPAAGTASAPELVFAIRRFAEERRQLADEDDWPDAFRLLAVSWYAHVIRALTACESLLTVSEHRATMAGGTHVELLVSRRGREQRFAEAIEDAQVGVAHLLAVGRQLASISAD